VSLRYIIREGLTGITRSKMAFMISVFSVTSSLFLVGVGTLAVDNGLKVIENLQADYDLEVFLENDSDTADKRNIAELITSFPGVIRLDYLSKEDAARLYNAEFGEDVLSVLDDNPLPSSFRIAFEDEHREGNYIQSFIQNVESLDGVDEVIFKKDLFDRIQGLLQMIYIGAASALFLLILVTVFLTSNNLRLMILARYDLIETIRLLGATDFMVKAPFFLEGGVIGFIGGLSATLLIVLSEWLFQRFLHVTLPIRIMDYPELIIGILIFGISLASLGVLKAVRRMLRFVS
jgi:cell division transport system permease protein